MTNCAVLHYDVHLIFYSSFAHMIEVWTRTFCTKPLFLFFIKGNVIYVAHNHGMAYFSDIPKYDFLILIYQKGMTKYLLTYTFSDHSIVIMLQLSNAF